jgi:predicted nucleic acid-binding protein
MVAVLFDTNILIDYLNGIHQAKDEINLYNDKAISIITWMEVQIGTAPPDQAKTDQFLARFMLISIDQPISREAVMIRKGRGIKLPDAIIFAAARVTNRLFVTRNTRDFPVNTPGVRVPYTV